MSRTQGIQRGGGQGFGRFASACGEYVSLSSAVRAVKHGLGWSLALPCITWIDLGRGAPGLGVDPRWRIEEIGPAATELFLRTQWGFLGGQNFCKKFIDSEGEYYTM